MFKSGRVISCTEAAEDETDRARGGWNSSARKEWHGSSSGRDRRAASSCGSHEVAKHAGRVQRCVEVWKAKKAAARRDAGTSGEEYRRMYEEECYGRTLL